MEYWGEFRMSSLNFSMKLLDNGNESPEHVIKSGMHFFWAHPLQVPNQFRGSKSEQGYQHLLTMQSVPDLKHGRHWSENPCCFMQSAAHCPLQFTPAQPSNQFKIAFPLSRSASSWSSAVHAPPSPISINCRIQR